MTPTRPARLTAAQARRIALAAQGVDTAAVRRRERGDPVTRAQLLATARRLGVVQVDSVNVLTRAHYLPFFTRLGDYDRAELDGLRDRAPGRLVEYWAHEASLIPVETWPLLAFRMRRAHEESWGGMQRVAAEHPEFVARVRAQIERDGPATARDLARALGEIPADGQPSRGSWWDRSRTKHAVEHLFWAGEISTAGRTGAFERRYASLAQTFGATRVPRLGLDLPREATGQATGEASGEPTGETTGEASGETDDRTAYVELTRIAARALGIATADSLRDYFRLRPAAFAPALAELLADGTLEAVEVAGWRRPAYLHVAARRPRTIEASALVSPFDSLIWHRPRTAELFGFHYRIEIYVPAHRRVHGYYVLPFLFGDTLVARADLKADRAAGVLRVPAIHLEPGAPSAARPALVVELERLAGWLGLSRVDLPTR